MNGYKEINNEKHLIVVGSDNNAEAIYIDGALREVGTAITRITKKSIDQRISEMISRKQFAFRAISISITTNRNNQRDYIYFMSEPEEIDCQREVEILSLYLHMNRETFSQNVPNFCS